MLRTRSITQLQIHRLKGKGLKIIFKANGICKQEQLHLYTTKQTLRQSHLEETKSHHVQSQKREVILNVCMSKCTLLTCISKKKTKTKTKFLNRRDKDGH